ncbi:hypothetical protein RCIP0067_00005 [Klebsiella phage RCIP0067]
MYSPMMMDYLDGGVSLLITLSLEMLLDALMVMDTELLQ